MLSQSLHVRKDVFFQMIRESLVIDNVLIGDIAKRKIDPTGFKMLGIEPGDRLSFAVDPLNSVKKLVFKALAGKKLKT